MPLWLNCEIGCGGPDTEQEEELFRRQRLEMRERVTAKLEAAVRATRCGATEEATERIARSLAAAVVRMLEFSYGERLVPLKVKFRVKEECKERERESK